MHLALSDHFESDLYVASRAALGKPWPPIKILDRRQLALGEIHEAILQSSKCLL